MATPVDKARLNLQMEYERLDAIATRSGRMFHGIVYGGALVAFIAGLTGISELFDGRVVGFLAMAGAALTAAEKVLGNKETFARTRDYASQLKYEGVLYDGMAPPYDQANRNSVLAQRTAKLVREEQEIHLRGVRTPDEVVERNAREAATVDGGLGQQPDGQSVPPGP